MTETIGLSQNSYFANGRQTEILTFDGFTLLISGGTITGTVSVYGFNK